MSNQGWQERAIELRNQGVQSISLIAVAVGADKSSVLRLLGSNCDIEQWEVERIRHAEFFGKMTPAQEYAAHYDKRSKSCELHDERF